MLKHNSALIITLMGLDRKNNVFYGKTFEEVQATLEAIELLLDLAGPNNFSKTS